MKMKRIAALLLALAITASVPVYSVAADDAQATATVEQVATEDAAAVEAATEEVPMEEQIASLITLILEKAKKNETETTDEETTEVKESKLKNLFSKKDSEETEETEVKESKLKKLFSKDDKEETEKKESKIKNPFEIVANVYILVSRANPELPHVWVYIENISNETLKVGHYSLPAGETLSMGSWRDRGNGAGIHYNLERYWVKEATYGRTTYVKAQVTRPEIAMATATINVHDYWSWPFNCGWFATSVWNKCTLKQVIYLFHPNLIEAEMTLLGGKPLDFNVQKLRSSGKVYKHTKDGLVNVCANGLYTNTGV